MPGVMYSHAGAWEQEIKERNLMNNECGRKVFIVDGSRTPQLKSRGKVGPFSAGDLAVAAAKPLLLRNNFPLDVLDEVILGCMMPG